MVSRVAGETFGTTSEDLDPVKLFRSSDGTPLGMSGRFYSKDQARQLYRFQADGPFNGEGLASTGAD